MYVIELADPPPELAGRLVARIMPDPATAAFETAMQRRQAHALRALVEIATWEANDDLDSRGGHPWLTMRLVLEAQLGTGPSR